MVVFRRDQLGILVKPLQQLKHRTPYQHTRGADKIGFPEFGESHFMWNLLRRPTSQSLNDGNVIRGGKGKLLLKLPRQPSVIRIEKAEPIAASQISSIIA